ncbi:MAG: Ig-like domain-containing protein [Clostridia bacterium]|nr:Ig-like domain-containing protein [Clostridia bacterium]
MKIHSKFLSVLLAAWMLAGTISTNFTMSFAAGTNYVVNGDFETDSTGDWKPDQWSASSNMDSHVFVDGNAANSRSGKSLKIMSTGAPITGSVTQEVYGVGGSPNRLPDGIYTMDVWVNADLAAVDSISLTATDSNGLNASSGNIKSQLALWAYTKISLQNIQVTAGKCTVGLSVTLNGTAADWAPVLYVDDISFIKTGEINYIVNGNFQTDSTVDWKPDYWTASAGIDPYTWLSGDTNKVLSIKSGGSALNGTVTQAVYGLGGNPNPLPEGVYTLKARVTGDPAGINSLKLFAKGTGGSDRTSIDLKSGISSGSYMDIELTNIEVTAGNCSAGLMVELTDTLAAWTWIMDIDDVSFVKTGEIGEQLPTIDSLVNPVPITTIVNQAPVLPAKVTANLSNGSTSNMDVNWSAPAANLYTGKSTIGTRFTVNGTVRDDVAGRDIPVQITVTVTCKPLNLNSDGTINVGDLAIASYYFGASEGSTNWNSAKAADVNGDGIIDNTDLQIIGAEVLKN